jgi:hypothetical protein
MYAACPNPSSVASADFNGDGIADLAVIQAAYNGVLIMLTTGCVN